MKHFIYTEENITQVDFRFFKIQNNKSQAFLWVYFRFGYPEILIKA